MAVATALKGTQERDHQPLESDVAIEERMNRLKLHVDRSTFNKNGRLMLLVMHNALKIVETLHQSLWLRRGQTRRCQDDALRPFHRQHAPRKLAIIELEAWSGQRSGCHCRPNIHELPSCSTASASPSRERHEIRKERGRTLTP
jgi:hypothetical protein